MKPGPFQKPLPIGMRTLICLALALGMTAQTSSRKENRSDPQPSSTLSLQQELVQVETGFFEAWRTNDLAYFREHMAENGVFWGEDGVVSRDQQLSSLEAAAKAKTCTMQGFGLSDFGALPLASGAYLLTYKAQQYGTCNGEKLPIHMNGSSIYILKAGHWQVIYRAIVPQKNES
jgi:hypothetical protein